MPSVLIVDDEAHCRFNIRDELQSFTHWRIVAELANANTLHSVVNELKPDVVFLDISMPGRSGIDAARTLTQQPHAPVIVFMTAYNEYAVDAFELEAMDYLLKPFDNLRFSQCIQRIENRLFHNKNNQHLHSQLRQHKYLNNIALHSAASLKVIPTSDISHLLAAGNYVEIHHGKHCDLYRSSLSAFLENLDPEKFLRVHRTAAVNISFAKELLSLNETKNVLRLKNESKIPVSEKYKATFIQRWLKKAE